MSQKSVMLAMLKENGAKGVSVHDLIYRHGITRAAAIVFELRKEGWDVLTVDGKEVWDEAHGRNVQELATYVLKVPMRTLAPATQPGLFDDIPLPKAPVLFDCGCVRSADGRLWEQRCRDHANAPKIAEVRW